MKEASTYLYLGTIIVYVNRSDKKIFETSNYLYVDGQDVTDIFTYRY